MTLALALATWIAAVASQASTCEAAGRFLTKERSMVAVTEPDTIDDWRTGKRLPGCRVTAAGLTAIGIAKEAAHFYELLRAVGWVRTPDPRDSPNEASLRFRKSEVDCLFNVYTGGLLNTDAEIRVSESVTPTRSHARYGVFVMCVPALPAQPRLHGG